ncbi:MAG TPA: alkaline phytoceramidase [Terriglobia bacterium]|nr:alkaline phytoceramidase [Terriglobia bacterium]
MRQSLRLMMLGAITLAAGTVIAFVPRVAQSPDYHHFADQRMVLGIPNFLNVISNVPFLIVGIWGLVVVLGVRGANTRSFVTWGERWPYIVLCVGVALTCLGSAYYHLVPNNARLVWDRLPMTLGFMSLLCAMLMERVNPRIGLLALVPLVLLGVTSVVYWYLTELRGAGDLRPYIVVQFYTLALILLMLWLFPARYTRGPDLLVALGFYVLAKIFESLDRPIYNLGHIISGHTLKHIAAAVGIYWIFRMLALRNVIPARPCRRSETTRT